VPQRDRVALAVGQLAHLRQQRAVLDSLLGLLRGIFLDERLVLHRSLQAVPPASRTKVVERRVACDAEQPGRRRRVPSLEAAVCLVRVHEDLRGDVLGVGGRADLRPNVGIYSPEIISVEIFERRPLGCQVRFMVCDP